MSEAVQQFLKKEQQPMCQCTYWVIYLAVGLVYVLKTLEASAHGSYNMISAYPEIAEYSSLVKSFFL